MEEVTIWELRNRGGHVLERVLAGERLIVTRDGRAVAELRPLHPTATSAAELLARWRRLPPVDPGGVRSDLDKTVKPDL